MNETVDLNAIVDTGMSDGTDVIQNALTNAQVDVYKKWSSKIRNAWQDRKMTSRTKAWATNYSRLYGVDDGSAPMVAEATGDGIKVSSNSRNGGYNALGQAAEEFVSLCYPTTPMPIIEAEKNQAESIAPTMEFLCHRELKKTRHRRLLRQIITDGLCADFAIAKMSYLTKNGVPQSPPEASDDQMANETAIIAFENQALLQGTPIPVAPQQLHWLHLVNHQQLLCTIPPTSPAYWRISGHILEHKMKDFQPEQGECQLDRISPACFLWDTAVSDPSKAEWIAERRWVHIDELKRDPLVMNLDGIVKQSRRQVSIVDESGNPDDTDNTKITKSEDEKEGSYVDLWVIQDKLNNQMIMISLNHKDNLPLTPPEVPWPYDCQTYHYLDFSLCSERQEKRTILERAWPLQMELDVVEEKIQTIVDEYMPKIFIGDGGEEPGDLNKITNTRKIYEHVNPNVVNSIKEFNPTLNLEPLRTRSQELIQRIRQILGVWEITNGVPQSDSATEAQLMANKEATKLHVRQDIIADFLSDICTSILKLHKQFTSTPMMVQIHGPEGLEWSSIRPEEIPSELHVTIDRWSWDEANSYPMVQMWNQALPMLMQMGDPGRILVQTLRMMNVRNPNWFLPKSLPLDLPPRPVSAPANPSQPQSTGQLAGNSVSPSHPSAGGGNPAQGVTMAR